MDIILFKDKNDLYKIYSIEQKFIQIGKIYNSGFSTVYGKFKIVKNKIWWSTFEKDFSENFKNFAQKIINNKMFI